uniref:BTB/POZ domain-containing protein 16 n=2 Tax=Latimeria chalumnae TaxID=7897 RepID=H3AW05_LATCH
AFAVALASLYHSEVKLNVEDIVGILAAAAVLQISTLFQKCITLMIKSISSPTVCKFYCAGCEYKVESLVKACERWLELNLIPQFMSNLHFHELPMELLQRILKSPRLFTYSEYHLLKTVIYWVFLKLNPKVQVLPTHGIILAYFNSLPWKTTFLKMEIGQKYIALFQSLRLHGVTNSQHLKEMQQINLLPKTWMLRLLTHHYHALHNGGDMPFLTNFSTQALRFGLFIEEEPQYYSKTISLYGFYFELKAFREKNGTTFTSYMQKIEYTDPNLHLQVFEPQSYSLRQEREVQYEIKVQSLVNGKWEVFSTGKLIQVFGNTPKTCKSQVLQLNRLTLPLYVTFAFLFPSS